MKNEMRRKSVVIGAALVILTCHTTPVRLSRSCAGYRSKAVWELLGSLRLHFRGSTPGEFLGIGGHVSLLRSWTGTAQP
jgi:hypothetical protein